MLQNYRELTSQGGVISISKLSNYPVASYKTYAMVSKHVSDATAVVRIFSTQVRIPNEKRIFFLEANKSRWERCFIKILMCTLKV